MSFTNVSSWFINREDAKLEIVRKWLMVKNRGVISLFSIARYSSPPQHQVNGYNFNTLNRFKVQQKPFTDQSRLRQRGTGFFWLHSDFLQNRSLISMLMTAMILWSHCVRVILALIFPPLPLISLKPRLIRGICAALNTPGQCHMHTWNQQPCFQSTVLKLVHFPFLSLQWSDFSLKAVVQ